VLVEPKDRLVGAAQLRLDTLSLFTIVYAAHLLFDALAFPAELEFWRYRFPTSISLIGMVALALGALAWPRSIGLMLGMMAARLLFYVLHAPVDSNNVTISSFAAFAVAASACYLAIRDRKVDRVVLTQTIAPLMRDLLLIMYFYGVLHKINSDFLNPTVSCAVALYKPLMSPFGLQNWTFGQFGAIYSTFIVECVAIVLLLSRRWKFWGLAIGIPFHLIIGFSGYAFYMDFSLLCLSLYVPFLPQEYFVRVNEALRKLPGTTRVILMCLPAPLFAATLIAGRVLSPSHPWAVHAMPLFGLIAGIVYLSILIYCPIGTARVSRFRYLSPAFALLSTLFLLNGFSPYIGFKTESSVAMFSNLRTEDRRTNHLLITRLPYLFSYQDHLVTILSSSAPELQPYIGPNRQIVEYDLHRLLARNPGMNVRFAKDGVIFDHVDATDNQYLATNWLFRQLLIFKPVDWTQPKPCTH